MIIYSMTATFGKLQNETITLQPGLNVIHAPNEWGKSTWCAFLVNMLYGLDTRAKTTKTALADKDRYAPWSGLPMSGRIDLHWNGRDITIERRSRGRVIFGDFQAYETATGLPVPELNGINCGQMLLGVERNVFTRAGFLTLKDLPVTQDDALRRRLNNLVTTGDESGAGDRLKGMLRDLKNKCRSNRTTGLIPQAEAERDRLEDALDQLTHLQTQIENLQAQKAQLQQQLRMLKNHQDALNYQAYQNNMAKISALAEQLAEATQKFDTLQQQCAMLPPPEQVKVRLAQCEDLLARHQSVLAAEQVLPALPDAPAVPDCYAGISADDAVAQAQADSLAYATLLQKKQAGGRLPWIFLGCAAAIAAVVATCKLVAHMEGPLPFILGGGALLAAGIACLLIGNKQKKQLREQEDVLCARHPGILPTEWVSHAMDYAQGQKAYALLYAQVSASRAGWEQDFRALANEIAALALGQNLQAQIDTDRQCLYAWEEAERLRIRKDDLQAQFDNIRSVLQVVPPPKEPDTLTLSQEETDCHMRNASFQLTQISQTLDRTIGRHSTLGDENALRAQLRQVKQRIAKLENTYRALELAENTLADASNELQRRFAPKIANRARELFRKLTADRYDRLTLTDDLSLNTCAEGEDTLRSALWRSDGTSDQLYFALRLAVAEELTPDAPLVLDDALVRFDDVRHGEAMDILQQVGHNKQVILFTCQDRESKYLEEHG